MFPHSMDNRRRLDLRGEVLLYIGFLWLLNGWFVYQAGIPTTRPLAIHELYLPIAVRALAWTVTGIVAICFAFRRQPGNDRMGFGFLVIMPAERALSWFATAILGAFGVMGTSGFFVCLGQSLVWSVVTILIYRIGASRQLLVVSMNPEKKEPGDGS
jgi:hypothetical protein